MAEINIDVYELSALAATLRASGPRVGTRVSQAVRKSALDVERGAKMLAPVDTGNLRNSISTTITGSGSAASISADIGPTANYGAYLEYGTSRMRPQPYMGPALDRVEPGFVAAIEQLASRIID